MTPKTQRKNKPFCRVQISSNNPLLVNQVKRNLEALYPHAELYRATATYLLPKKSQTVHLYLKIERGTKQ
jgi:hypothetical protein